jgi:DNA-binding transcriptional ArsR family regulator
LRILQKENACQIPVNARTINLMVNRSTALTTVFAALADPTRRRILQGLMSGQSHVAKLAQPFRISAPAISRHLRVLERAGLIRRTKRGRNHEIELSAEPLRHAKDWLETYRRHWEASLDALAQYLESTEPQPSSKPKTQSKKTP